MEQYKFDRINELARKAKETGLTEEEKAEQTELRDEYRAAFRRSLILQLDNTYVMTPDGEKHKLEKNR